METLVTIVSNNIHVFVIHKLRLTHLLPQNNSTLKGAPHHVD